MKFENTFDVEAPIDEVYAAMLDVERVAPCVPGAQVLEQTSDDTYKVADQGQARPDPDDLRATSRSSSATPPATAPSCAPAPAMLAPQRP